MNKKHSKYNFPVLLLILILHFFQELCAQNQIERGIFIWALNNSMKLHPCAVLMTPTWLMTSWEQKHDPHTYILLLKFSVDRANKQTKKDSTRSVENEQTGKQ